MRLTRAQVNARPCTPSKTQHRALIPSHKRHCGGGTRCGLDGGRHDQADRQGVVRLPSSDLHTFGGEHQCMGWSGLDNIFSNPPPPPQTNVR